MSNSVPTTMSMPPPHPTSTSTLSSRPPTSNAAPYTLAHLDDLLTTYLTYLDTYTTHRTQLSTSLSTGFLNLARAQRSSMLPPGQRYGQEMYDQRMKAGRRVKMVESREAIADVDTGTAEKHSPSKFEFAIYSSADTTENPTSGPTAPTEKSSSSSSPPSTPAPTSPILTPQEKLSPQSPHLPNELQSQPPPPPPPPAPTPHAPTTTSPLPSPKPKTRVHNPLTQFSLLPPSPLRTCQGAFTTALLSNIPNLINTSHAMAELENEIERVRKALGLSPTQEDMAAEVGAIRTTEEEEEEEEEAEMGTEMPSENIEAESEKGNEEGRRSASANATTNATTAATATPSSPPTTPKRRNLAGRRKVSEPRSRVLKLGT